MNAAIEIGRMFDAELRRLEHQREDTDARAAWIAQRAAALADAMARSPAADQARLEALERRDLTESRSFIPGWIVGCGTSLLLVLGYTLIAWSH